jgi:hypothetical protein
MLSLSLDRDIAAPRGFVKDRDLLWNQAFLGDWSKTTGPGLYGVDAIPSVFLIDPDGRVIGVELRGEKVKEAVRRALRRRQPAIN